MGQTSVYACLDLCKTAILYYKCVTLTCLCGCNVVMVISAGPAVLATVSQASMSGFADANQQWLQTNGAGGAAGQEQDSSSSQHVISGELLC